MKKTLLLAITVILVLFAGCTTAPSGTAAPGAGLSATPSPSYTVPPNALPMNGSVRLGNDTHAITVSVDATSFEISPETPGVYAVTIYVAAKNTGKDPIKYTWFSTLTDLNGNKYGGIGISHGGNGARTEWILPNFTEEARDYVEVPSNQSLSALAGGAVLDVDFMEQKVNVTPSLIPDYHVTWVIDPDTIR